MSTFTAIAPRPAPDATTGPLAWCKANLFHDWKTTLGTVLIGVVLLSLLPRLFAWTLTDAVWNGGYEACHAGNGAAAASFFRPSAATSEASGRVAPAAASRETKWRRDSGAGAEGCIGRGGCVPARAKAMAAGVPAPFSHQFSAARAGHRPWPA